MTVNNKREEKTRQDKDLQLDDRLLRIKARVLRQHLGDHQQRIGKRLRRTTSEHKGFHINKKQAT